MDRMKTFLTYLILLVGFFAVSMLLENGLLHNMYASISGDTNGNLITSDGNMDSNLTISVEEAKASNVSGNLKIKVTVNNIQKPTAYINFIRNGKVNKNSIYYKNIVKLYYGYTNYDLFIFFFTFSCFFCIKPFFILKT